MKNIIKGAGPQSLHDWVQGQREAGVEPAYADLQAPQKGHCRAELVMEQGALCCYCNMRISIELMHIEHLEPQENRALQVEWTNLLGCCKPRNERGRRSETQSHCGEFRGDDPVGVSPLDPDCEAQFRYTLQGEILGQPSENSCAKIAIENLNLRAERLRSNRKALIDIAYEDIVTLTVDQWLETYVKKRDEQYPEFAAMFRWFYYEGGWESEHLAMLAEHAN